MNDLMQVALVTRRHQDLLDSFCEAVGVAGAVIDLEGTVLIGSRWQRICTDYHRRHPDTCALCVESDTVLTRQLLKGSEYALYECRNGLLDAAAPVIVNGEHLANAFIGQFTTRPPDREAFRARAEKYGFPVEEYLAALDDVPILDEQRLPYMVNFIKGFAVMVAESYHERQQQMEYEHQIRRQAQAILDLSTPVIKVWEGIVAAPLIGTIDGERAQRFMERFLGTIVATSSCMSLLDITGVPEVDTQSAQCILDTVNAARMLGADVILTGVSPPIAQTLVHLGIDLKGMRTSSTLAGGLRLALEMSGQLPASARSLGVGGDP